MTAPLRSNRISNRFRREILAEGTSSTASWLITLIPGILTLQDVSRTGRVLLTKNEWRLGIIALAPGSTAEQDLSFMDFSAVRDISPDGKFRCLMNRVVPEGSSARSTYVGWMVLRQFDWAKALPPRFP